MLERTKKIFCMNRRELFSRGGLLSAALFGGSAPAAPSNAGKLQLSSDIYKSIGVRPLINCRGTLTVISGSLELPEVRAAKDAAAQHFVQMDELMDAVGQRLAELTGAEFGMVSSGCAAGLAHATTACVIGSIVGLFLVTRMAEGIFMSAFLTSAAFRKTRS